MKKYIDVKKSKTFAKKTKPVQKLINHTLYILDTFGIPVDGTPRRIERMAIAFLACGGIKKITDLKEVKDLNLKTRDIIAFVNKYFKEEISSGSYDDIRRKDLKLLTVDGVVIQSSPNSATNDSSRGYNINPVYASLLKSYGDHDWLAQVELALKGKEQLKTKLLRRRELTKVKVSIEPNTELLFSTGKHNDLQKAIIEEFLPRYGYGAKLLYVGDTSDKYLYLKEDKLKELKFFEMSHEELPDILAYSEEKNWLYLIEAVHSSGAISEIRLLQLQELAKNCTAELIYVTAFLDRPKFRKFIQDIAWETEVWIAENPDHLIHFNGDKFLGPYKP